MGEQRRKKSGDRDMGMLNERCGSVVPPQADLRTVKRRWFFDIVDSPRDSLRR